MLHALLRSFQKFCVHLVLMSDPEACSELCSQLGTRNTRLQALVDALQERQLKVQQIEQAVASADEAVAELSAALQDDQQITGLTERLQQGNQQLEDALQQALALKDFSVQPEAS